MSTQEDELNTEDPLRRVRQARRRYWAARAGGEPSEIEHALRQWVDAQIAAAEHELEFRGWVVNELQLDTDHSTPPRSASDDGAVPGSGPGRGARGPSDN